MSRYCLLACFLVSFIAVESQAFDLPIKFGFCKTPSTKQNFNASDFFNGKWYVTAWTNNLPDASGRCQTVEFEYSQSQIATTYENYAQSDPTDIVQEQGQLVPSGSNSAKYSLKIEDVSLSAYIIDTDYAEWAVLYACDQLLFTKMELEVVLEKGNAIPDDINDEINAAITQSGFNPNDFRAGTEGCISSK